MRRQDKAKEEQKRKAARKKAAYDEANEKHPRPARTFDPPVKIRDPYLRKLAQDGMIEQHRTTTLALTQLEDRLKFLEKLEQERAQQQVKLGPEFSRAAKDRPRAREDFTRAAEPGRTRAEFQKAAQLDPAKAQAIARTVAKIREKENQEEKEHERGQRDQGRGRSLSDTFNKAR